MKENHTMCATCKKEKFNGLFRPKRLAGRPCDQICMKCISEKGKRNLEAVIGRGATRVASNRFQFGTSYKEIPNFHGSFSALDGIK